MKRSRSVSVALLAVLSAAGTLAAGQQWNVPGDFPTLQVAVESPSVIDGDTIRLAPGDHTGVLMTKSLEIRGEGGARITAGPPHSSGLIQGFRLLDGSHGATFSHLTFTVDLAIMNGAGINDVTVTQCTFLDSIQAVSNWRGNRWEISHNKITDLRTKNGGGIGILIGDYTGGDVFDNVVSHNDIEGTLHVFENDGGGYSGTGIVLYADYRWLRDGTHGIAYNRVVKNKVSLVSDDPGTVDVVAFEMTDTRNDGSLDSVIFENTIGFNDWRGTTIQTSYTPSSVEDSNPISRNLGDNRGHGMHPGIFGPE